MGGPVRQPMLGLCAAAAALLLPWQQAEAKDLGGGWEEKKNEDGKVVQSMKIEAPAMTEEDQYGYTMPDRYKCDACKAVMFHLQKGLVGKHPKSRRLKAWEYTDVMDDTCATAFDGYGIKLIDGENALSGPGLPREEKLAPGSGAIQMSSENWSKRLGEICRKVVYERMGEEEVYDRFYEGFQESRSGLSADLCTSELRDCRVGPKPPKKQEEKQEEPKKASKKAKKTKEGQKKLQKKASTKAAKAKAADAAPATAPSSRAAGGEKVDVQTYLRNLAVSHGLTSDEYLAARTPTEWEKLTVAMASRIFNQASAKGEL